jgi:hypothetical protein
MVSVIILLFSISCCYGTNIVTSTTTPSQIVVDSTTSVSYKICIFNFVNKTSYRGKWELSAGFPKLLKEVLELKGFICYLYNPILDKKQKTVFSLSPKYLCSFGKKYSYDYIIVGEITKFDIYNFGIINPLLYGYNRYAIDIKVEFTIYDVGDENNFLESSVSTARSVEQEFSNLITEGTGWGRKLNSLEEFYKLEKVELGSSEWRRTKAGYEIMLLMNELAGKIENFIRKK